VDELLADVEFLVVLLLGFAFYLLQGAFSCLGIIELIWLAVGADCYACLLLRIVVEVLAAGHGFRQASIGFSNIDLICSTSG
jgi:hypothetical protein